MSRQATQAARYERQRRAVLAALCTDNLAICACCDEARYSFLTVDHIHGGGVQDRKRFGHTSTWRLVWSEYRKTGVWPRDRYRVLCANCNQSFRVLGACEHRSKV